MAPHVHILVSPKFDPTVTYEEVVPDSYHKHTVVRYYEDKGWDVLLIEDAEICGAGPTNP